MNTAVLVTRTRWTEMPRLRHQIARALAGSYRVLFVETPMGWRGRQPTQLEEVEPGIVRCRITERINLPQKVRSFVPGANDLVQKRLLREITASIGRRGWGAPAILVNFNYDATGIMEAGQFDAKFYVCNDDWVAKAQGAAAKRIVAQQEARVGREADLCLAVSYPLVAALKEYNPSTRLFLPGHDFSPTQEVPRASAGRGLRIVFMGNVNRRVNGEWLRHVASQPGMEMHTVGTIKLSPAETEQTTAAGVHFHEPMYGADLSRFLQDADVFVIPYHLFDDVIAVTASNKLFNYIAAARPVVISDMPHFIDFGPGIIYRADSKESFVENIRRAAAEDSEELRARRRMIAEENSWANRGRELRGLIEEVLVEKTATTPQRCPNSGVLTNGSY